MAFLNPITCQAIKELRFCVIIALRGAKIAQLCVGQNGGESEKLAVHLLVRKPVRCANEFDAVIEETSELQQRQRARALRPKTQYVSALVVSCFCHLNTCHASNGCKN